MKTMNAKTIEAALNKALYAAADKAGFGNVLRRYHGEVGVSAYAGTLTAFFSIDDEIVNADHECEREVAPSLRPAMARAGLWLSAYCRRNFRNVRTA